MTMIVKIWKQIKTHFSTKSYIICCKTKFAWAGGFIDREKNIERSIFKLQLYFSQEICLCYFYGIQFFNQKISRTCSHFNKTSDSCCDAVKMLCLLFYHYTFGFVEHLFYYNFCSKSCHFATASFGLHKFKGTWAFFNVVKLKMSGLYLFIFMFGLHGLEKILFHLCILYLFINITYDYELSFEWTLCLLCSVRVLFQ